MTDLLTDLKDNPVLIIFRGQDPRQCADIAETLYEVGIRLFEVTLNSDDPYAGIAALRERLGSEATVGAGTVLTTEQVDKAADAGAQFIVSPDIDVSVVEQTKSLGMGSVPGAFTPTEVLRAVRAGGDAVKVFPIKSVGADHIRQMRGPLPEVPFVATGGVDSTLAKECIDAGCVGVGVGVHLLGDVHDVESIASGARKLVNVTTPRTATTG